MSTNVTSPNLSVFLYREYKCGSSVIVCPVVFLKMARVLHRFDCEIILKQGTIIKFAAGVLVNI